MSAHTPGPLLVSEGARADGEFDYAVYVEINGKRQIVAEFFGTAGYGTKFDSKSNARLYAAAPDLLEALTRLLHQAEGRLDMSDDFRAIKAARAAIAKATSAK